MLLSRIAERPLEKPDAPWRDWMIVAFLWLLVIGCLGANSLDWQKYKHFRVGLSLLGLTSAGLGIGKLRDIEEKTPIIARRRLHRQDMLGELTTINASMEHEQTIARAMEKEQQQYRDMSVPQEHQAPVQINEPIPTQYEYEARYQSPIAEPAPAPLVDIPSQTQEGIELFNWDNFRIYRDQYPHLGIAGKTGGGKSTLAEYLASLFDGYVVAIAPHWKAGDFTSANLVVGWGRDFGKVNDCKRLSFPEVMSGHHKVSACGFMGALLNEMDRRYQLDENQEFVGKSEPEVVVILDEFNAWASSDGLPEITSKLLREARKVKIRLIPLVQGTEVEAMGCKGQGQLREQITWVMISNKAKAYASTQLNLAKSGTDERDYWQSISEAVARERYPAFVGDLDPKTPAELALIPDLSQWKSNQPKLAALAGWDPPSSQPTTPTPDPRQSLENCLAIEICPYCSSTAIVGHGTTAAGTPRKRCGDCGKTWTVDD